MSALKLAFMLEHHLAYAESAADDYHIVMLARVVQFSGRHNRDATA